MSDGPHRSLPLRRAWKLAAAYADNPNHSLKELREAIQAAVSDGWRSDVSGTLARSIAGILDEGAQKRLPIDRIKELEQLRRLCQSPLQSLFIDSAIDVVRDNASGRVAIAQAVESTLLESALRELRSIEEHYLRETRQERASEVRARLEEALGEACLSELASTLANDMPTKPPKVEIAKHDGVDEGVPL